LAPPKAAAIESRSTEHLAKAAPRSLVPLPDKPAFKQRLQAMNVALRDSGGGGIVERFDVISKVMFAKFFDMVYPHVLEGLVARVAASGNRDTNYGKINRIVHPTRREAADLTDNIKAFLAFAERHSQAVEAVERASSSTLPAPQLMIDEIEPPPAAAHT
jgi:hypothetical protein